MTQTIIHLQRLSSYGVAFHSYTEPYLATDNELVRNILLALLSSLTKVEAQKISEPTRAGMSRARAKGVKIGRPKLPAELRHEIIPRAARGETAYAIPKALHITGIRRPSIFSLDAQRRWPSDLSLCPR